MMNRILFCYIWGTFGLISAASIFTPVHAQEKPAPELTELEQKFTESLNQSALVGHFSIDGKELNDLKQERYEIESVQKFKDDLWTFNARIKYGMTDVKIPLVLKVVWAEDTPMISMTDVTIPGMGTFTARVFFYDNRYAGTWQHGKVGGHMWGSIEKLTEENTQGTEATK